MHSIILSLACVLTANAADVKLTLLRAGTPGKCMDGSPGGYYFERATTAASSNKWVFDLEGGGECVDYASCSLRIYTHLGSSRYFSNTTKLRFLSSGDSKENPYAHTWNRVFIPYCSQDLWSGTREKASKQSLGFHFSGHIIVQQVFAELLATTNLGKASDVVVTGESAGGIGSWINVGWFKKQLHRAQTVVAPVAGFYAYAFPYTGPSAGPPGLADFSPKAWSHHYNLWQSHVDDDCKTAFPETPWVCMLSNNSRPSINVPAFVIEAQTDMVQLEAHDNIPHKNWSSLPSDAQKDINDYIQRWKQNMTENVHSHMRPKDGYFMPACYIHTSFSKDGPFIMDSKTGKEYTYSEAFGEWHAALGSPDVKTGFRLEDTCGLFCGKCSAISSPLSSLIV